MGLSAEGADATALRNTLPYLRIETLRENLRGNDMGERQITVYSQPF